jgi:hypothetical protein
MVASVEAPSTTTYSTPGSFRALTEFRVLSIVATQFFVTVTILRSGSDIT